MDLRPLERVLFQVVVVAGRTKVGHGVNAWIESLLLSAFESVLQHFTYSVLVATMAEARSNKIQVCVRLRPLNKKEKKMETTPVVQASSVQSNITVVRGKGKMALRHGMYNF